MAPLRQRPSAYMKDLTGDLIERFGADLLTQIQLPLRHEPDIARRQLAEMLVVAVDGKPELLDQLRAHFVRRLHRASNDFPATAGLRVTEAALSMTARLSASEPAVTKT